MTRHTAIKLLYDALNAAARISRFVEGRTKDEYVGSEMLRSAVERQFEIMGEALTRLQQTDRSMAAKVPDLRAVISFRNRLIHGYDSVDDEVVWTAATHDLTRAIDALSEALRDLEPPGG